MSRRMDEEDWPHMLRMFRACLPRRGRKAEDDRHFLEAFHCRETFAGGLCPTVSGLGTSCGNASTDGGNSGRDFQLGGKTCAMPSAARL